jgi:hypothetical protein
MSLTERDGYFDLRARYLRLLNALRRTRKDNPETLAAMERVLPPETVEPHLPPATAVRDKPDSKDQTKHAA